MMRIVIATLKSWNIKNALRLKDMYKNLWDIIIITSKEELNHSLLNEFRPDYIFFSHWSWKIPGEIHNNYECIGFHLGDLPKGRGGSPLQNHILRKYYHTKITAFRIRDCIDCGEIYLKKDFYIGVGSAEELFIKMSDIIFFEMIPYIVELKPKPQEQSGEETYFKRRTPDESNLMLSKIERLEDLYDFVRMLDAEGYPRAYIRIGRIRIELSEAKLYTGRVMGRFEALEIEEDESQG